MTYETKVRPEKVEAANKIKADFEDAPAVVLTEYRGLTVTELADLRAKLRDAEVSYKVVKNTLARIVVTELGHPDLAPELTGPTAIAYVRGDVVSAAKALAEFAKEHESLVIKAGLVDGEILSADQTRELSTVDTLDVSRAKIAGLLTGGLRGIAAMLEAPSRKILFILEELAKRPEAEAAAPPAEPPAEAAAEEAAEASAEEPATSEAPAAEASAEEPATEADATDEEGTDEKEGA